MGTRRDFLAPPAARAPVGNCRRARLNSERELAMPDTHLEAPAETRARARADMALPRASLRIIATAIVLFCVYYAREILISLICSMFIAFVLEPGVKLIQRLRIPRWIGALLMVLASLAAVYLLIYLVYDRVAALISDLPNYAARLRQIVALRPPA